MEIKPNYFGKELLVLKLVGVPMEGNEGFGYKIYSCLMLILLDFCYPILQFSRSFQYGFDDFALILSYDIGMIQGAIKAVTVLMNRKKIIQVLDKLESLLFSVQSDPHISSSETKLVNACLSISTMQSLVYWVTAVVSLTGSVLRCLIKYLITDEPSKWELPYGKLELLNTTRARNFEIMLGYEAISIGVIACHLLTIDLIAANVLCHLSYHFKILRHRIVNLIERSARFQEADHARKALTRNFSTTINKRKPSLKCMKTALEETVKYHSMIIETAEEMEAVFSNVLLLIMINTIMMLCLLIYFMSLISGRQNDYAQIFQFFSQCCIAYLQIFILCFWGEQISTESVEVATAVMEMDFVGCDLKFQKSLTMIMVRGQKPVRLSAGKLATVGLPTFTWIIRNSYSAFIVLKNVNRH